MNYRKFNLFWWFGNVDEPNPPYEKWRGYPYFIRKILWFIRNPFHNFTFYVIGVADKVFVINGIYSTDVFRVEGGWKYHFVIYKWLWLPFISYSGKFKFYIGWREKGNFGIKLTKRNA